MNDKLKVKLLHPNAKPPARAGGLEAGYDLYALEYVTIAPFEVKKVRTGVAVEIPWKGWYGKIFDRSSIGSKGLAVHAGVIDYSYRGEIQIVMQNLSVFQYLGAFANRIISKVTGREEPLSVEHYEIKPGDKISQIVFMPHAGWEVEISNELSDTERGEKGFGSTSNR